jgi:hypothetical protein
MMIVCIIVAIILSLTFLIIIIFDKTCQTVPMILVANSCIAALTVTSDMLGMAIFTLINDLKQIQFEDRFCSFRGYLAYASLSVLNYSFLLQAFYRYVTVVYPTRLFWKSRRNQGLLICLTWLIGFAYPVPAIFIVKIIYNVDNQICQVPLGLNFSIIYLSHCIYAIPTSMIIFIYFKLFRYIHQIRKHVAPANILSRAQRELKMVRQTVILVIILVIIGFPYFLFILMSFFTTVYKYHFRIAYIFVYTSLALEMIFLLQFTEPLKTSIMKRIR